MKVIKPLTLGVLTRPFEVRRQVRLGVSVFACFPLVGEPRLHTEQALWRLVPEVLGAWPVLDEGIPKSRGELLVAGRAFPKDRPAKTCPVRVSLGAITKEAHVVGDRFWADGVPTDPIPFEAMPVDWDHAYGGAGFDANPRGKGHAKVPYDGVELHPLPNVERPGALIVSPDERPDPVGLGALDFAWPQRARFRGTYDQRWLETRYPGLADDEDWRIWNLALPDQQQDGPFAGDEPFVVENMHPDHPRLEGTLPNLRARAFAIAGGVVAPISNEGRPAGELVEIGMRLMTVWLFPEHARGVLVFQGALDITEDDGRDVSLLCIAAERIGAPRPREHYDEVVDKRCDRERAGLEMLFDDDLVPGDLPADTELRDPDLIGRELLRERMRAGGRRLYAERAAVATEHGLDAEQLGAAPPDEDAWVTPPLRELPARLRELEARLERERRAMKVERERLLADAEARCAKHGVDFGDIRDSIERGHRGPPEFRAEAHRDALRVKAADAAAKGAAMQWLEEEAEDAEAYGRWQVQETQLLEAYRVGAHLQPAADPMSAQAASAAREAVLATLRDGGSLAGRDLTGIDLSGADLSGADLRGALLESATLAGARLDGAELSGAVLAHADLTRASLLGAVLRGANLGGATLTEAIADERTDLSEATLMDAKADRAVLAGAILDGAMLIRASFANADLRGARLAGLSFVETTLTGARFEGADVTGASFLELDLTGASFEDARGAGANFVRCVLAGVSFARAAIDNVRIVHGSSAPRADFRHAQLSGANLRGVDLKESDFSGATLHGADLSETDLRGAKLFRVRARRALFVRADLRDAVLMQADLMEAQLARADVRRTDFRGASLYGADFARVRGDASTLLDEADQTRARVHPQRQA